MRKIYILIFLFIVCTSVAYAQTLNITNVSVINDLGHVRISWEYTGSNNLEISRDSLEIGSLVPIQLITNPASTSFIDRSAAAHTKSRSYKISDGVVDSKHVASMHLTFEYDSCAREIDLTWDDIETNGAFTGNHWTPAQFTVHISEDGITRTEDVNGVNQEYSIQNILENTNYIISIETKWETSDTDPDSTSFSNPISKYTEMPVSPDYINAISASVDGNNTNLQFEIAPNSELDSYKLLKSDSRTGLFDTLETISSTLTEISTTDYNSQPESNISYYKLVAANQCGNPTTNSDIINNILLTADLNEFDVNLNWNNFKDGSLTPTLYEIYRIIENNSPELVGSFSNNTDFDENIEQFQSYTQFCYYVRAFENSNLNNNYSQSNIACVYLKPKVYIAEAFTPNDDGTNDIFQPVFSFIPTDFEFRIYNRWGNIIFETSNYSEPWDGKTPNGSPAPTGTYIYYYKIKTPNGQIVEKRGNVTVIYP